MNPFFDVFKLTKFDSLLLNCQHRHLVQELQQFEIHTYFKKHFPEFYITKKLTHFDYICYKKLMYVFLEHFPEFYYKTHYFQSFKIYVFDVKFLANKLGQVSRHYYIQQNIFNFIMTTIIYKYLKQFLPQQMIFFDSVLQLKVLIQIKTQLYQFHKKKSPKYYKLMFDLNVVQGRVGYMNASFQLSSFKFEINLTFFCILKDFYFFIIIFIFQLGRNNLFMLGSIGLQQVRVLRENNYNNINISLGLLGKISTNLMGQVLLYIQNILQQQLVYIIIILQIVDFFVFFVVLQILVGSGWYEIPYYAIKLCIIFLPPFCLFVFIKNGLEHKKTCKMNLCYNLSNIVLIQTFLN
eukprot:TRINITY_DN12837_c0_g1_i5.p1 TRINITY_DN12837_c0_g1~~TRINITY_DN12837_c0_g1_i5.p1  ORF type:complete len:351 (-),score=-14.86 TRINITY_DN12837_c0_g1_i5:1602-2654(-)